VDENNFDKWNNLKKEIDNTKTLWTIKTREIYWLRIGKNIGFEQNGKGEELLRPTLIYKKFNKEVFLGIPLTTQIKDDIFHFEFKPMNTDKINCAILSQIRLFSSKRIKSKFGKISKDDFIDLKSKLKTLMEL
jgi:mRNA interferase MazF